MNLTKFLQAKVLHNGLAILAGASVTLAFAPFNIFPLSVFGTTLLLFLWLNISAKQAFWRGFLFGLGLFGTGTYWVFTSIHTFGGANAAVASLFTAGFVSILALFPALTGFLLNKFFPLNNTAKIIYAFPAFWVLLEWVRSWILTGFPWLLLGYSQVHSPLKGYAPLLSVYGVSFAVALSSSFFVMLIYGADKKTFYQHLIKLISLWLVGSLISLVPWTHPVLKPVRVSLIQGNIPQDRKSLEEEVIPTLQRYKHLTEQHWDSNIIIWPEGAIPISLPAAAEFVQELSDAAKEHHATLISGVPIPSPIEGAYYNSIIATGEDSGIYLKHHLVPYGEFLPFRFLSIPLFKKLGIPLPDMVPSPHAYASFLKINGLNILPFICYEISFPELVLNHNKEVNLLLTVSNDAWFGESIALAQHLQTAQMRSLEMARPSLFVANSGLTAFISPDGNLHAMAQPYQTAVLTDYIQGYRGITPWQKFGMDPILVLILLFLWKGIRSRRNPT